MYKNTVQLYLTNVVYIIYKCKYPVNRFVIYKITFEINICFQGLRLLNYPLINK